MLYQVAIAYDGAEMGDEPCIGKDDTQADAKKYVRFMMKHRETCTLKNRMDRYEKRLIREGLLALRESPPAEPIKLDEISEEYVDTAPLIDLAKKRMPSLYRRFRASVEKYLANSDDLKKLVF